ncbi:hypothetical protein DFH08DRAFT_825324 [Mycena albidolilacea]|uniref:Uncharacterized protein n=1 Tax=Mycena albidolilacea TaxID=1033008 RepID=A0AAD6Z2T6_9AGAR|nr:hypothetical protein DFH08DRAFT_825324 [Mycena albidolilacea]
MVFDWLSAFMEVLRALPAKTLGTYFLLALVYFRMFAEQSTSKNLWGTSARPEGWVEPPSFPNSLSISLLPGSSLSEKEMARTELSRDYHVLRKPKEVRGSECARYTFPIDGEDLPQTVRVNVRHQSLSQLMGRRDPDAERWIVLGGIRPPATYFPTGVDLGEKIIFHQQTWRASPACGLVANKMSIANQQLGAHPLYKINTEPKPGFEKDPDPKKIEFERHPWGSQLGFFL